MRGQALAFLFGVTSTCIRSSDPCTPSASISFLYRLCNIYMAYVSTGWEFCHKGVTGRAQARKVDRWAGAFSLQMRWGGRTEITSFFTSKFWFAAHFYRVPVLTSLILRLISRVPFPLRRVSHKSGWTLLAHITFSVRSRGKDGLFRGNALIDEFKKDLSTNRKSGETPYTSWEDS